MRFRPLIVAFFCLFAAQNVQAQCVGKNLIDALSPAESTVLRDAALRAPFAIGNFWQATRGTQTLYIAGTFHLDDPRHAAVMDRLRPYIAQSKTLLVEAGPKEQAALQTQMATNPASMMNMAGSGLKEALIPAE